MKRKIFTILMMFALVIVAGSALAQTKRAPYVGGEQSYSWTDVTTASYVYEVTTTTELPNSGNRAILNTDYSVTNGSMTPGDGPLSNTASTPVGITWLAASDGNTYYVWLVGTSDDGCNNYRYVSVTPSNAVDFILASLGLAAEDVTPSTLSAVDTSDAVCPTPDLIYDEDYLDEVGAGVTDDGTVFAYFSVAQGSNNTGDTWEFDFTAGSGTATYYNGSSWVAVISPITASDGETIYVRVEISTPLATAGTITTITADITNNKESTTGLVDTVDANDHTKLKINRVPAIGDFVD